VESRGEQAWVGRTRSTRKDQGMGDSVGLYMHGAAWGVPVADKEHRRRVDDTRRDDDAFSPYSSSVSNPSNEASNRFDLINGKFSSRAFLNDERLFYGTDLSPESPSERGGSLSNIVNSVLSSPNKGSAKATVRNVKSSPEAAPEC